MSHGRLLATRRQSTSGARADRIRCCAIRCRWCCTCRRPRIGRAKHPRFAPFAHQPGDLPRPDTLAVTASLREHATGLIRVLGDDGAAAGPWQPQLSPQQLRSGLEMMLRTRHFDARMIAMQRQGRLSFYVSSKGEEASAVAGAMAYAHGDMLFPSYRQPGLLLVRGMPLLSMMCQLIGNRCDNAKGRQMPVHYSWRAGNVVSISSPVGTQLPQAVGAAMAFAYRGERRVVGAWIGDGTAAQGDFHHALNFASVFRPPCVLHVVDNQWAISTHRNLATGGATFAARADAYRLPGLRVDGNDFLAVYAAEAWAIERARRGGGPTLVELRHLSPRGALDERRSDAISRRRRGRALARRRSDRAAQTALDPAGPMVRRRAPTI